MTRDEAIQKAFSGEKNLQWSLSRDARQWIDCLVEFELLKLEEKESPWNEFTEGLKKCNSFVLYSYSLLEIQEVLEAKGLKIVRK